MKLPTKLLKLWANTLDETLSRSGLPVHVSGGETADDGRTIFDIPAPDTIWSREMARKLGVQEVRVKLQIEVIPLIVVVVEAQPEPRREQHLEADWTPCYVRTEDVPTNQGCQHVTGVHGIPYMTGG